MLVIMVLFVIALLPFVLFQIKFHRRNKLLSKIPSPPKDILLHNSLEMIGLNLEGVFNKFEEWYNSFGEIFHITLHPFDDGMIFIADAKIAEALSLHQPDRSRSDIYKALTRWVGADGFLFSSGNRLKSRMKPVMNVFHPKFVDTYINSVNSQIQEVLAVGRRTPQLEIDFFSWARETALDVTFEIVLGFQLNSKHGENKEYVEAIRRFCEIAMTATFDPISRFDLLHPFTSLYREEKKTLKILHDFTLKIVQDRRKQLADGTFNGGWLMLNHYLETTVDGKPLTDTEIREEIDSMIFGAHDTTKTTIAFLFHSLAKHPEIQQKVYEEAKMILKDDVGRRINDKDLLEMPYIEAVIKETLRMYPPVPYLGRKISSEITTGGYTFPKDAEVVFSPYLMGRNPKYFEDPLTFNPDRFYGVDLPPLGYIPFSIGARKCPGGKLAIMSLKIVVAKTVSNMKFSLVKGHEKVILLDNLILTPKDGIILLAEQRTCVDN